MSASAILLSAGYATRLYPLTKDRPKALLPLNGGSILDEIVMSLPRALARRVLVTNHRFAEQFRAWQRERKAPVEILDDGTSTVETRLGAIRDLQLARTQGGATGDLLVIGTDNLFRWSLDEFVTQAKRHPAAPSIALWQAPTREEATQFGVVMLNADGRITTFAEKSAQPPSALVSTCVYYFPEAMLGRIEEFLASGENADAPGYFIKWLAGRMPVYGVTMSAMWYDIGTLAAYEQVRVEWPKGSHQARAEEAA